MGYAVNEVFHSIQGEGFNSGTSAVFCRFSGCNLWSGREASRGKGCSAWCDTEFRSFTMYDLKDLSKKCSRVRGDSDTDLLVCTGGEPLLQLDDDLVNVFHDKGFRVAVETNGTVVPTPKGIDWVTVSPKGHSSFKLLWGNELKLIWPQEGIEDPSEYLYRQGFEHFFLQPLDTGETDGLKRNTDICIEYVKKNPVWRLSLQTHKWMGIR